MQTERYTRLMLTVIAACLIVLAADKIRLVPKAHAEDKTIQDVRIVEPQMLRVEVLSPIQVANYHVDEYIQEVLDGDLAWIVGPELYDDLLKRSIDEIVMARDPRSADELASLEAKYRQIVLEKIEARAKKAKMSAETRAILESWLAKQRR